MVSGLFTSRRDYFVVGLLILSCLLIRSTWTSNYEIQHQMDAGYHSEIILSLERFEKYNRSPAPFYYAAVAAAHMAIRPDGTAERDGLSKAVHIVNSMFFILFVAGFAYLSSGLFNRKSSFYLCLALVVFSPALNRIFSIARPEILMVVMYTWCLALVIRYGDDTPRYQKLLLCVLLGIASAQKINGLFFYPMIVAVYLSRGVWRDRKKTTLGLAYVLLGALVISGMTIEGNKRIGGRYLWQHISTHTRSYHNTPTVDIFVRVKPIEMLRDPFRNNLSDSMASILFTDLFGDYFNYGINSSRIGFNETELKLARARFGVLLSYLLVVLLFSAFIAQVRGKRSGPAWRCSAAVLCLSIATLVTASFFNNYNPAKFDIMKWDYIPWAIPFLFLPVVAYRDETEGATPIGFALNSALAILLVGSMLQSVLLTGRP